MRDKDVGFLPVCDEAGGVVGVITDRDLVVRVWAEEARPAATQVGSVMTRGTICCRPTHTLGHAERLMRRHHLTRLLVTDDRAHPVGVVSLSDIAQYERASRVGQTLKTIAERKYAPERP